MSGGLAFRPLKSNKEYDIMDETEGKGVPLMLKQKRMKENKVMAGKYSAMPMPIKEEEEMMGEEGIPMGDMEEEGMESEMPKIDLTALSDDELLAELKKRGLA